VVSKARGARGEGLSGVEGLLAVVGLDDDGRYQDWYRYGEMRARVADFRAAVLKLRAPNDVQTNGPERERER